MLRERIKERGDRRLSGTVWNMTCDHEFEYVGDQKAGQNSNRYFKCRLCGAVKVRSDDGTEYMIPAGEKKSDTSE